MPVTVTRLRPLTTVDDYGDIVHTGALSELAIDGCGLAPATQPETTTGGRQGVGVEWELYCPHGSDIEATDLVRAPNGALFRVDGHPAEWTHMHTGWQAGMVVPLARYEG